jgi:hypothetical protein
MLRQTILVAASLLGVAFFVLGEEAPYHQRPQRTTIHRRKTASRKTYQLKPSPVVSVPQVKIQPSSLAKPPVANPVQPPPADDKDKKAEQPRPQAVVANVQPPPAEDRDKKVEPARPQAAPANPSSPMSNEHGPADAPNGTDDAPVVPTPPKVVDAAERQLYLTPGGKYTAEDIKANGNMTASQKYAGFKASHDRNPRPGDKICPITDTKANPKCTWIVGGKTYEFCCPPCIDEFVRLAKENPDKIKEPEDYVQK